MVLGIPTINKLPDEIEDFGVIAYGEFFSGNYKQNTNCNNVSSFVSNVDVSLPAILNASYLLEYITQCGSRNYNDQQFSEEFRKFNFIAGRIKLSNLQHKANIVRVVDKCGNYNEESRLVVLPDSGYYILADIEESILDKSSYFINGIPYRQKDCKNPNFHSLVLQTISASLYKEFSKYGGIVNKHAINENSGAFCVKMANVLTEDNAGKIDETNYNISKMFPLYVEKSDRYNEGNKKGKFHDYDLEDLRVSTKIKFSGKILDLSELSEKHNQYYMQKIFSTSNVYIKDKCLYYDGLIKVTFINKKAI